MNLATETAPGNEILTILAVTAVICLTIGALVVLFYIPFKEERDYIKMEMRRCSEEKDYLYWRKELRNLYLRTIPLIGRFFK